MIRSAAVSVRARRGTVTGCRVPSTYPPTSSSSSTASASTTWTGAATEIPLLLLAGLGCTAHIFAELAPHLSDRFRVLALTRRGHGLTDQVQSGHALADAAEDARRLLDALGIERAHVVGHSMGGGEVSALAARHPGRVARVVYLDGAYDWADSPTPEWPEEAASPDRFASYERLRRLRPLPAPRRHPGTCPRRDAARLRGHPARTGRWSTSTPPRPLRRSSRP